MYAGSKLQLIYFGANISAGLHAALVRGLSFCLKCIHTSMHTVRHEQMVLEVLILSVWEYFRIQKKYSVTINQRALCYVELISNI